MSSTPLHSPDMFFSDIVFPSPQLSLDFSEDDNEEEQDGFSSDDDSYSATLHNATLRQEGYTNAEDYSNEDGYDSDDTMNEESVLRDQLSRIIFASRCRTPTSDASSPGSSTASSSASSDTSDCSDTIDYTHINYEDMIDELLSTTSSLLCPLLTITFPSSSHTISLKSYHRSSPELFLLLELNHPSLRSDPWNPSPHILNAVERGEYVFLIMNALVGHNEPKMKTYGDWLDFGTQILEGGAFLHQQKVIFRGWGEAGVFMADIGLAEGVGFERGRDPVKYYLSTFAQAKDECDAKRDVRRDTSEMVKRLEKMFVQHAPALASKLKPFFHPSLAYECGEDARKEYEAIAKTLPGSLLLSATAPPSISSGINGAGLLKKVFSSSFRSSPSASEQEAPERKRFVRLSSFTVTSSSSTIRDEPAQGEGDVEGGRGRFDASTLTLVAPTSKLTPSSSREVNQEEEVEGEKERA